MALGRNRRLVELAVLFCAALAVVSCGKGAQQGVPAKPGEAQKASQEAQAATASVTLLYPDAATGLLAACPVPMALKGVLQDDMTQVVKRYLDGTPCDGEVQPFLQGTSLRGLFLLDNGVVVLDLTGPAASGGGSDTENARVYGLVDTICYNFKGITSARILVDGREVETLLGHLDLSRPLPPEWGLAPGIMAGEPPAAPAGNGGEAPPASGGAGSQAP